MIPLFRGGENKQENLQPLCRDCHVEKSAADMREARPIGHDETGIPLHPAHPWNLER